MLQNLFANLPDNVTDETIEQILKADDVVLERIVSNGQSTRAGQWYDQSMHEWVLLIKGAAAILFEHESAETVLRPGDYIFIPAHKKHRVEWTSSDETTIWLALHLAEGRARRHQMDPGSHTDVTLASDNRE